MEPGNIWFHTHDGDSVSAMTSSLSGITLTTNTNISSNTSTMTTATTTHQDVQTPIRDDETTTTNLTTPSTRRGSIRRKQTGIHHHPTIQQTTNIPKSLPVPQPRFRTEAELDAAQDLGYDSDGYIPPFVHDEGELDFFEDSLVSILQKGETSVQQQQQPTVSDNRPIDDAAEVVVQERLQTPPDVLHVLPPLIPTFPSIPTNSNPPVDSNQSANSNLYSAVLIHLSTGSVVLVFYDVQSCCTALTCTPITLEY
jgi:hypothetical protein